jgi:hypothetical protein
VISLRRFFRGFFCSCRHFFGCANRNANADIVLLIVAAVLIVSLLCQPLLLTALALLGLILRVLFF